MLTTLKHSTHRTKHLHKTESADLRSGVTTVAMDDGTVSQSISAFAKLRGSKFDDFIINVSNFDRPDGTGWTDVSVWSISKEEHVFNGTMDEFLQKLLGQEW